MKFKYENEFRKDHPETIGEKDYEFDLQNYSEWLESKYENLQTKTNKPSAPCPNCNDGNLLQFGEYCPMCNRQHVTAHVG